MTPLKLCYTVATPEVTRMATAWMGDAERVLGQIADIGYGGVEVQTGDPAAFDTAAFLRQVHTAGLEVAGVSTGPLAAEGLYLTAPDEATRKETVRRLNVVTDFAAECGTHMTIGSIRGFARWAPDQAIGLGWFRDSLSEIATHAEARDVRVVLEPQNRQMSDMLNTMAATVAFIRSFGSATLALEADSYHMALEEQSVPAALVTGHRSGLLLHVQISDANRLAPGWGHLNWADFFATLQALDYDRWICVEAEQRPRSEVVARHTYDFATLIARG
jgi:5-keto-L-gluconate epimerase